VGSVAPAGKIVGQMRIVGGNGICHPMGDPYMTLEGEKALRRAIVERCLEVLQLEPTEPTEYHVLFRNWFK